MLLHSLLLLGTSFLARKSVLKRPFVRIEPFSNFKRISKQISSQLAPFKRVICSRKIFNNALHSITHLFTLHPAVAHIYGPPRQKCRSRSADIRVPPASAAPDICIRSLTSASEDIDDRRAIRGCAGLRP